MGFDFYFIFDLFVQGALTCIFCRFSEPFCPLLPKDFFKPAPLLLVSLSFFFSFTLNHSFTTGYVKAISYLGILLLSLTIHWTTVPNKVTSCSCILFFLFCLLPFIAPLYHLLKTFSNRIVSIHLWQIPAEYFNRWVHHLKRWSPSFETVSAVVTPP